MADIFPPTAFHFVLRVGSGLTPAVFQEVSGISAEMEPESVNEGGDNRFVHQLPKAVKHTRLTLKRGSVAVDSELVHGARKCSKAASRQQSRHTLSSWICSMPRTRC
jgi:phage tail-like protein